MLLLDVYKFVRVRVRVCVCVCAQMKGEKMRRKLILFLFVVVGSPSLLLFVKKAQQRGCCFRFFSLSIFCIFSKISFCHSPSLVWNKSLTFSPARRLQKIHTQTHTRALAAETVRSLLLLFLQRRIGAFSLSLSFLLLQFFSICSSRSSFTRRRRENYIWIAKTYNGFDSCVVVASILWNDVSRARVSSLIFFLHGVSLSKKNVLYYRAIWSDHRSDHRLIVVFILIIIVVVKNWERRERAVGVWNLNVVVEVPKKDTKAKILAERTVVFLFERVFLFKIRLRRNDEIWLLMNQ